MESAYRFEVEQESSGRRIDVFLAEALPDITRSMVQKLLEQEHVMVGGQAVHKNHRLRMGDIVHVTVPPSVPLALQAEDIPLDIVYEDTQLIVVNKPKGMVVHPGAGNPGGTMVNGLLYHARSTLSGIGGVERPGIVHRIDKDTSGLLVVAKTDAAHVGLASQLAAHTVTREYRAVVYGRLKEPIGTVEAPIGRSEKDRTKMAVNYKNGKPATTHYRVLQELPSFTYIACRLETGRTHQIRVHMASIGHPLAGDVVYGPQRSITELEGQCLHAGLLGFQHPTTEEYMEFSAPLPAYFTKFLKKCGGEVDA